MEAKSLATVDLSEAVWKKSSHSGNNGGNCVEVALNIIGAVAVRDSKNPTGPTLIYTPAAWRSFISAMKHETLNKAI